VAYYDEAMTIVAPQPLRTLNGYISRAGTPAQVYVDGVDFSILVQDSKGTMVYTFTGDQTLGTGNLIQGTAAKGINFTANTNAAGMTSELLNWYEEGTFTPTFTNLTVVGTPTYAGTYTRIGRLVYCRIVVTSTTSTSSTNGSTYFSSLPFTPNGSGICVAADGNTAAGYGNGILAPPNVYTPTWGASSSVTIALTYTT
jgi:hypothetical protein